MFILVIFVPLIFVPLIFVLLYLINPITINLQIKDQWLGLIMFQ